MKGLDVIRKLGVNVQDFYLVFSACLGGIYVAQANFEQTVLKGRQFKLNFQDATIEFEDGDKYNMQYLGSKNNDDIWSWGWDPRGNFPSQVIDFANQIKDFGEVHFVDYLKKEAFKIMKEGFAHDLSSAVCAMFGNSCFCEAKGPNGSMFVSVSGLAPEIFEPVDAKTFIQITAHALKTHQVNQRLFVEAFLTWNNIPYTGNQELITADFGTPMEIKFVKVDEQYKVETIKITKEKEDELVS